MPALLVTCLSFYAQSEDVDGRSSRVVDAPPSFEVQSTAGHTVICTPAQIRATFAGPNGQPMDDVFKEAIKRLKIRFAEEANLVLARYKFYTQPQDHHETINDFVSRLRELSVKCRFGLMTEELIRDQLIVQCRDRKIQERLWAAKDSTLQEVIEIAKVIKESQRCIKELEKKDKSADVMVLSTDSI
ncbi:hypothetical protein NDU88_009575 [Pleurodeles waltl]|uniref:Uncharacterized protein n=1 Tax=Pleurodeles waltl TaxID=8319 RepID=A0AAV7PSV7_PLEWA|nr:hypothetical protein NDU88_009575 [Pleurodeles waltl]